LKKSQKAMNFSPISVNYHLKTPKCKFKEFMHPDKYIS